MRTFRFWLVGVTIFLVSIGVAHARGPKSAQPKNIILMIGDGMGPAQVEAGRLLVGLCDGTAPDCTSNAECMALELGDCIFDLDAEMAVDRVDSDPSEITTLNIFGDVTDSAAAGTALATGEKTYNGAISVNLDGEPLETVLERAENAGKATGILSSVDLTCATPAVWAAHALSRSRHFDIALQQAVAGVEVLLAAGRFAYLPLGSGGQRGDGRNLVEEMMEQGYSFVDTADELMEVNPPEGKLLGLFGGQFSITYALDRELDNDVNEPTLAEMTAKAIEVLSSDRDGFFMMVEGGAIDWLSHNRDVAGTAGEMAAFDQAVQVALDFAIADGETLVVVTADHETGGLSLDAPDGDFIRGITATTDFMWGAIMAGANVTDTLELYANLTPSDPDLEMIEEFGAGGLSDVLSKRAGVSWGSGVGEEPIWSEMDDGEHTDTAVPVYAFGPGAEAFEGADLDNTDIGKLLLSAVSGRRR